MIDTSKFNYENFTPSMRIVPEEEKVTNPAIGVLCSQDRPLSNSHSIFIEYYDIIEIPFFYLLYQLDHIDESLPILQEFYFHDLRSFSREELFEWYIKRDHRNFLENRSRENITNLDTVFEKLVEDKNYFDIKLLPFHKVVSQFCQSKMVEHIYLWTREENRILKNIIHQRYQEELQSNVTYLHGSFSSILPSVHPDSTFVFSDIRNILELEKNQRLDYTSIVIPLEYGYNYDKEKNFIIDIDELTKKHIFKLNLFSVFESKKIE